MLAKAFYQQVGQHADLPRRVRRWRSDDVEAGLGRRVLGHDTDQSAGSKVIGSEKIRQCRDAKPGQRSGGDRCAVVGLEASTRVNGNHLVTVQETPAFRALHQRFVRQQCLRRLRFTVFAQVIGSGHQAAAHGRHAARNQA